MLLYCIGTDSPSDNLLPNIVLYDYQNSRDGTCSNDYLGSFKGYLQVDGYVAYEKTKATLVGCMVHVRRKFKEAMDTQPKGKSGKANWALNHIQKLYRLETMIKEQLVVDKYQVRQEKAAPLLNQFKAWLNKSMLQVPP